MGSHLLSERNKTQEAAATRHPLTVSISNTMHRTGTPTFRYTSKLLLVLSLGSFSSCANTVVGSGELLVALVVGVGMVWSRVVVFVSEWFSADSLTTPSTSVSLSFNVVVAVVVVVVVVAAAVLFVFVFAFACEELCDNTGGGSLGSRREKWC